MPRWKKPTAGRLARCRLTSLTSRSAVSATRGFMCNGVRLARCRLTSLTSRSAVSATRGFMCNGSSSSDCPTVALEVALTPRCCPKSASDSRPVSRLLSTFDACDLWCIPLSGASHSGVYLRGASNASQEALTEDRPAGGNAYADTDTGSSTHDDQKKFADRGGKANGDGHTVSLDTPIPGLDPRRPACRGNTGSEKCGTTHISDTADTENKVADRPTLFADKSPSPLTWKTFRFHKHTTPPLPETPGRKTIETIQEIIVSQPIPDWFEHLQAMEEMLGSDLPASSLNKGCQTKFTPATTQEFEVLWDYLTKNDINIVWPPHTRRSEQQPSAPPKPKTQQKTQLMVARELPDLTPVSEEMPQSDSAKELSSSPTPPTTPTTPAQEPDDCLPSRQTTPTPKASANATPDGSPIRSTIPQPLAKATLDATPPRRHLRSPPPKSTTTAAETKNPKTRTCFQHQQKFGQSVSTTYQVDLIITIVLNVANSLEMFPLYGLNNKNCDEGYGALGKYLQQTTTNFQTTCYQCERTVCNVNRVYNHHVYVELELRKNLKSQLMTCKLSEFEKSIEFSANNNTFRLKGIIGYSPGHFVAFCWRSNNQWELHNDLSTKEVRITHDPTITPTAAILLGEIQL
ncbi:hypothetical protein ACJJTC_005087 [Scirpophaga incertulas]